MRMARLIPARIEPAQPRTRRGRGQQRHLAVLMRQRPRREPAGEPRRDIVAEQQRRQHVAAGAAAPARRPPARRAAPASPPDPRRSAAPRTARSTARRCRSAAPRCADRATASRAHRPWRRCRQSASRSRSSPHFGPLRAGQDHAQRVEQHELGMLLHGRRDILPRRRRRRMPPVLRSAASRVRPSRHIAVAPPSTTRPAPFMKPASSEARNTMPLAMSIGTPRRPERHRIGHGLPRRRRCRWCRGCARATKVCSPMSVWITPGWIELTRIR